MSDQPMMEQATGWTQALVDEVVRLAPTVLLILGVAIGGLVAASLLRKATVWAVRKLGLEALAEKFGVARLLYTVGVKANVAQVSGQVVYYAALLLTLHSVAEIMGLRIVSQGMTALMGFVPSLLSATAIMVAGVLGADVLARVVRNVGSKARGVGSPEVLARGLYYLVIILAGTIAAEQLGLAVTLINSLIQIVAAAAGLGLALAFAFGAREAASNWVARHYVTRLYRRGDRVRVREEEGIVLNFSPTSVILDQGEHEVVLPCRMFLENAVRLERLGDEVEAEQAPESEGDAP